MDISEGQSSPAFRCKMCRHVLFTGDVVVDSHSERYNFQRGASVSVCKDEFLWFLQEEELPAWIADAIEKENWTKGRLICPNCSTRLGSFDYICCTKCACHLHTLPSVHFSRGKIDCSIPNNTSPGNCIESAKLSESNIKTFSAVSEPMSVIEPVPSGESSCPAP